MGMRYKPEKSIESGALSDFQTNLSVAHPVQPLTVFTLGQFSVYIGDELIKNALWKRRKAKSLFKLLLLAPKRQIRKDTVLEWLWPGQDPHRATNNMHRTIFVLRRVLQPDLNNAAESNYVFIQEGAIILNKAAIASIDSEDFKHFIRIGKQGSHTLACFEKARELYKGDFLPEDLYEDWASIAREDLRKTYCSILQDMAVLYIKQEDYSKAESCLRDLLNVEPTREEAHRELMRLYTFTGQRHQAIQLYKQARTTLQQELDIEPSAETISLYQAIVKEDWSSQLDKWNKYNQDISRADSTSQSSSIDTSAQVDKNNANISTQETHPSKCRSQPTFVGREAELENLCALLSQTEARRGNLVLICGEQGVGKTRLAEEFLSHARDSGMRVLHGAAYEQEGGLPYGPFVGVIRNALVDSQIVDSLQESLGPYLNDLAKIIPELNPVNQPVSPQLNVEIGQSRQRLFDAVTATLVALAKDTGLVVFLDDLHAAGESSLQLVHYLTRHISSTPILIISAIRNEKILRGTPIERLYNQLVNNQLAHRIKLSRLSPVDTSQLCTVLLDNKALTQDVIDTLYGYTEGNPFYIQELVLALVETRSIEKFSDGSWHLPSNKKLVIPPSIRDVVGMRLGRLTEEAQDLAGLASVIGLEFDYDLLLAATKLDGANLLDLLDELLNASLIHAADAGYRFHHGVTHQVIYDELITDRRIWLHGKVAKTIEQLKPHQLDEHAATLVYHYENAKNETLTFQYLIRAGNWALTTYASREALEYYNRAFDLCEKHPELADTATKASLLHQRAQIYITLSDFDAAINDLQHLLTSNQESGDKFREGETLYQLGIAHYWGHRLMHASSYLGQAADLAKKLSYDELYAKAHKLQDILNSTRGDLSYSSPIETSSDSGKNQQLPAEEHWGLALLAHLRSDFGAALHHSNRCIELGQSYGNPFLVLGGYFVLGMSYTSLGEYQVSWNHLQQAVELSKSADDRFWRARILNTIGWLYRELFNLEKAVQYDQDSLEFARLNKPLLTEAEGNALANLAADYYQLKDFDRAKLYLDEGLETDNPEPFMRWRYHTRMMVIKGRLALAEDDIDGALAAADAALEMARSTKSRKNIARSCRLRGKALFAVNRFEEAKSALKYSLNLGLDLKCPRLVWPCYLDLAQFEETAGNLSAAQNYYLCAFEVLDELASKITDPSLYNTFLTADPVRLIFSKADRPIDRIKFPLTD